MENKVDFAKISDNVTALSGNILDVKLALDGIDDLLLDCTPQDEESRIQLAKNWCVGTWCVHDGI